MAPAQQLPRSASSRSAVTSQASRPFAISAPSKTRRGALTAVASAANEAQQQIAAAPPLPLSRRSALLSSSAASLLLLLSPNAALANPLEDATRAVIRPANALTDEEAVAALLDARATLKDLAELAATPADSQARFEGRKLWPAFARWLRPAGPAAPRVVALALGADAEAVLSSRYGGAGGAEVEAAAAPSSSSSAPSTPGLLGDELYRALGAVLTISGRTIREEARATPERALRAAAAIDGVLDRVPAGVREGAQRLRVAAREARAK